MIVSGLSIIPILLNNRYLAKTRGIHTPCFSSVAAMSLAFLFGIILFGIFFY